MKKENSAVMVLALKKGDDYRLFSPGGWYKEDTIKEGFHNYTAWINYPLDAFSRGVDKYEEGYEPVYLKAYVDAPKREVEKHFSIHGSLAEAYWTHKNTKLNVIKKPVEHPLEMMVKDNEFIPFLFNDNVETLTYLNLMWELFAFDFTERSLSPFEADYYINTLVPEYHRASGYRDYNADVEITTLNLPYLDIIIPAIVSGMVTEYSYRMNFSVEEIPTLALVLKRQHFSNEDLLAMLTGNSKLALLVYKAGLIDNSFIKWVINDKGVQQALSVLISIKNTYWDNVDVDITSITSQKEIDDLNAEYIHQTIEELELSEVRSKFLLDNTYEPIEEPAWSFMDDDFYDDDYYDDDYYEHDPYEEDYDDESYDETETVDEQLELLFDTGVLQFMNIATEDSTRRALVNYLAPNAINRLF